jgi:hypothetical protein
MNITSVHGNITVVGGARCPDARVRSGKLTRPAPVGVQAETVNADRAADIRGDVEAQSGEWTDRPAAGIDAGRIAPRR